VRSGERAGGFGLRAPAAARNRLAPAAVLAVVVVLAAGIGGSAHFTGPRWYPHISLGRHGGRAARLPPRSAAKSKPHHIYITPLKLPTWLGVAVLVMVAIGLAAVILRIVLGYRQRLRAPALRQAQVQTVTVPVATEPEPEPERLLTGIELALRVLDEVRDPADAVVRAWLGLQETAAQAGVIRAPWESPTEFTARIIASALADDSAVRTLLDLYLRVRFGEHPVSGEEVEAARGALAGLVASWRRPAGALTGVGAGHGPAGRPEGL